MLSKNNWMGLHKATKVEHEQSEQKSDSVTEWMSQQQSETSLMIVIW